MPRSPSEESFDRLLEEASRKDIKAAVALTKRLLEYAGSPGVADNPERMSVREDLIVNIVSHGISARSMEGRNDEPFRILDVCCGLGGLASHLAGNLSAAAKKLAYLGVDHNNRFVVNARKKSREFASRLRSVEFELREVWALKSLSGPRFDLVVLNNTLHELPPHRFPELFSCFNDIINKESGRVCVIDMQELPIGEPEAIAINWKLDEVEAILRTGGFQVIPSRYQKSVGVLCVSISHAAVVHPVAMLREIRKHLHKKLAAFALDRAEAATLATESDNDLMNWIVVTGSTARCAEELLLVDEEIARLDAVQNADSVASPVGLPGTKRRSSSKFKK